MSSTSMKDTWLVQRLRKPHGFDNPFSFGGGLKNGGLSDEAMTLLRGVFGFDYMGAAEFEFGAVPKALNAIARNARSLTATSFTVTLADVRRGWDEKGERVGDDPTIYMICDRAQFDTVRDRVTGWACDMEALKEHTLLPSALVPTKDFHSDTRGWLELDNGFFFFVDYEMWYRTAKFFGVEIKAGTVVA